MRIFYVSGRYRVYGPGRQFDRQAMAEQVRDEHWWAALILSCGHFPLGPLANSVPLEGLADLHPDAWIDGDLALLLRLRRGYDGILMRPGWDAEPESRGARQEYELAVSRGLLVAHGMQGESAVREYLLSLHTSGNGTETLDALMGRTPA